MATEEAARGTASAAAFGRGWQALPPEDGPDGRVTEEVPQLGQLALDAAIAPPGVVLGQPEDEHLDLVDDGRAAARVVAAERPFGAD